MPTLWCTLRGFDKDVQRAVIQNFNLAMLAVTFTTYVATGIATREMVPLFAIVAPAMLIPSLLGARLYVGDQRDGLSQGRAGPAHGLRRGPADGRAAGAGAALVTARFLHGLGPLKSGRSAANSAVDAPQAARHVKPS